MDQNNETLFRHYGYRDGLAGNIYFPPEIAEHKAAYLDGYQIGIGDRMDEVRNSRAETETD
jgi:hypothetical protein